MYHTIYVRIHRNVEEVDASVKELPYNGRSKHDFSFSLRQTLGCCELEKWFMNRSTEVCAELGSLNQIAWLWLIISLWMVSRLQQLIQWLNVHHVDFCLIGLHTFDYWILIVLHSSMKLIVLNELNDISPSCMIVMTLSETNCIVLFLLLH